MRRPISNTPSAAHNLDPGLGSLAQFVYLQALDVLSTLVFLTRGVQEANPFVRYALQAAPSPLLGLAALKAAAVLFAVYCWRHHKRRLLGWGNLFYALLVVWNLLAALAA